MEALDVFDETVRGYVVPMQSDDINLKDTFKIGSGLERPEVLRGSHGSP